VKGQCISLKVLHMCYICVCIYIMNECPETSEIQFLKCSVNTNSHLKDCNCPRFSQMLLLGPCDLVEPSYAKRFLGTQLYSENWVIVNILNHSHSLSSVKLINQLRHIHFCLLYSSVTKN
jgi:hypothetical protein